MPPKRKEGDGKDDNDGDVQSLLLEKDLEIETLVDKISRLEKRSQSLANDMERQQETTNEMEEKLQDVIACLSSELKKKESKVYQLEEAFKDLKAENIKAIENFTKDMHELQNNHKFVTEDLRLQLANAEVQLRDIDEFREQKAVIEQEIASLKEQLEREKKDHQDAISDTERSALQEKQRLRKEMLARIEETKMQMLQRMDEQLDAVEDELAKRNLMNQRTIRILLYRLQEGLHADEPEDQQMKTRVAEHKKEDIQRKKELEQIKSYIQEQTRAVESGSGAEEAMKFLYACLDDIVLENASGTQEQAASLYSTDSEANLEHQTELPCSLDELNTVQRQKLLMNLLRTAVSLRAVAQNPAVQRLCRDLFSQVNCGTGVKVAVSVEDILSLSVEGGHVDELECGSVSKRKVISVGVQTESLVCPLTVSEGLFILSIIKLCQQFSAGLLRSLFVVLVKNLEERLALEIKERLRPCSSLGIVA